MLTKGINRQSRDLRHARSAEIIAKTRR
jgi:hypothetical protein